MKDTAAAKKAAKKAAAAASLPTWRSWGDQWEHGKIVAFSAGGGIRLYADYHLDDDGGMSCLLLAPRGLSVVRAARQLQRFFTIEQYRLLILTRLPQAKSRVPALAKLNQKYEVGRCRLTL